MFKFEGIPSGDSESFCWDVDIETFRNIKGKEPKKYDKSMVSEELYRIYPNDFHSSDKKCLIELKVTEL
jgi:hypothetical protein